MLALWLALASMLAAQADPQSASGLAPTGTLRAAFLGTNPVQGRVNPSTGAVTGPVADLVRELARRQGVPFRLAPVADAAAVIAQIRSGEADIGFLAYEAARADQVEFSPPYALMGSAYLVRADAAFARSADVDRAGVTIAAVQGASQQLYLSEHVRNARLVTVPAVPPPAAVIAQLTGRQVDAFALNRQRLDEIVRTSREVRILPDNFMVNGQAIVVAKGDAARLAAVNRFLTDVLASGFVRQSLEANGAAGVEVAPVPNP